MISFLKKYHKVLFGALLAYSLLSAVVLPSHVAAALPGEDPANPPKIANPIKYDNLGALLIAVAEEAAKVGFYIVVFFIIYSGFLFVKARGNEEELKSAKKTFLYTVIGAAILLGATILANVIEGTVKQLEGGRKNNTSETTTL
ncbi:MAG: hypothetical protein KBD16_01220 [Candidatus Pacebacteria bacterium]|nr:hypothetical protein [Candidatus Paceibacterota bacterium]